MPSVSLAMHRHSLERAARRHLLPLVRMWQHIARPIAERPHGEVQSRGWVRRHGGEKVSMLKGVLGPVVFPSRASVQPYIIHTPHTPAQPQPHSHTTMSHPATPYNAPTTPAMSYQCALGGETHQRLAGRSPTRASQLTAWSTAVSTAALVSCPRMRMG